MIDDPLKGLGNQIEELIKEKNGVRFSYDVLKQVENLRRYFKRKKIEFKILLYISL